MAGGVYQKNKSMSQYLFLPSYFNQRRLRARAIWFLFLEENCFCFPKNVALFGSIRQTFRALNIYAFLQILLLFQIHIQLGSNLLSKMVPNKNKYCIVLNREFPR